MSCGYLLRNCRTRRVDSFGSLAALFVRPVVCVDGRLAQRRPPESEQGRTPEAMAMSRLEAVRDLIAELSPTERAQAMRWLAAAGRESPGIERTRGCAAEKRAC